MLHISGAAKRLTVHKGNYEMFETKRKDMQAQYAKSAELREAKREKLLEYTRRQVWVADFSLFRSWCLFCACVLVRVWCLCSASLFPSVAVSLCATVSVSLPVFGFAVTLLECSRRGRRIPLRAPSPLRCSASNRLPSESSF